MNARLCTALVATLICSVARAEPPAAPPAAASAKAVLCQALYNRILRPRSPDRPLPLLAGDPAKGLHPACTVRWSALSPANQPLDVLSCFQGSLLQIENNTACGQGTGYLWVSSRWVLTSAEKPPTTKPLAMCEELETKAVAATRDIPLDCQPRTPAAPAPPKPATTTAPK